MLRRTTIGRCMSSKLIFYAKIEKRREKKEKENEKVKEKEKKTIKVFFRVTISDSAR